MKRCHLKTFAAATALLAGLVCWMDVALAQSSASATIAVSIEITANCTVAAEPLTFSAVTAADAPAHGTTASIEVACGPNVPFTVTLDDGQNSSDGARRALDPATGQYIGYDIFGDAAHTIRWGLLTTQSVAGVTDATGTERLTAYGLIGRETQIATGRYGDLVTVTTNF